MAHYAKLDNDNIVTEVIVADPAYISTLDESFRWVQTSYNNNFRTKIMQVKDLLMTE